MTLRSWLERYLKSSPSLFRLALLGLPAALWAGWAAVRRWGYRQGWFGLTRLPGTTVAVGNLTLGGSGKTPVVSLLVAEFRRRFPDVMVVVLSRGYGGNLRSSDWAVLCGGQIVSASRAGLEPGDEVTLLSSKHPDIHILAAPRRASAAAAVARQLELEHAIWILDDGFQHLQLHRDINLVLWHSGSAPAHLACAPLGYLRESPAALRAATHLWVHGRLPPALVAWTRGLRQDSLEFEFDSWWCLAADGAALDPEQPVGVVCAIASPQRFAAMVRAVLGRDLDCCMFFGDHQLIDWAHLASLSSPRQWITTEKDYYREPNTMAQWGQNLRIWVAPLKAYVSGDAIDNMFAYARLPENVLHASKR